MYRIHDHLSHDYYGKKVFQSRQKAQEYCEMLNAKCGSHRFDPVLAF